MKALYAIGLDYGSEGKSLPLTLVEDPDLAESIRSIISRAHGTSTFCVEVPLWPELTEE